MTRPINRLNLKLKTYPEISTFMKIAGRFHAEIILLEIRFKRVLLYR